MGGYSETAWGQVFCANLPTEEVFTTPHRLRVDGTVRGTRAVSYDEGVLVDGIELRFAGGEVVEAHASVGEEFLRRHLETDEGARRLGEVALVAGSRIGRRGLLFYNTLFDENAASHIAYGMAYTEPVEGASALDKDAQAELGVNDSSCTRTSRSAVPTSRSTASTAAAGACRSSPATTGCSPSETGRLPPGAVRRPAVIRHYQRDRRPRRLV